MDPTQRYDLISAVHGLWSEVYKYRMAQAPPPAPASPHRVYSSDTPWIPCLHPPSQVIVIPQAAQAAAPAPTVVVVKTSDIKKKKKKDQKQEVEEPKKKEEEEKPSSGLSDTAANILAGGALVGIVLGGVYSTATVYRSYAARKRVHSAYARVYEFVHHHGAAKIGVNTAGIDQAYDRWVAEESAASRDALIVIGGGALGSAGLIIAGRTSNNGLGWTSLIVATAAFSYGLFRWVVGSEVTEETPLAALEREACTLHASLSPN